jgi:tryptophan-rich sensory protein
MHQKTSAAVAAGAVTVAAGLGALNGPQRPVEAAWYGALRKPPETPPAPVVGAAWGVLELLLAGAGHRLLRAPPSTARTVALGAWGATLIGLAGYPYMFFNRKRLSSSTAASGAMLASAGTLALAARKVDPLSAAMTVPLVIWLAFATRLSDKLKDLNPDLSRD